MHLYPKLYYMYTTFISADDLDDSLQTGLPDIPDITVTGKVLPWFPDIPDIQYTNYMCTRAKVTYKVLTS